MGVPHAQRWQELAQLREQVVSAHAASDSRLVSAEPPTIGAHSTAAVARTLTASPSPSASSPLSVGASACHADDWLRWVIDPGVDVGAGTLNLVAWASPQIAADSVPFAGTPGLGSPLPHPHRDWAHLPHLHRDWAHPCHIGTGAGLTPLPHLHRDLGRRSRRTGRRRRSVQSVQRKGLCRLNRCAPDRQQAQRAQHARAQQCVHAAPCRRATGRAARPEGFGGGTAATALLPHSASPIRPGLSCGTGSMC